jgi:uncharacterized membrane protein
LIALITAIHVLGVVVWIGGVAFVTAVIFPTIICMEDSLEKALMFQKIESRFARHAWAYIIIVGGTGFLLLYLTGRGGDLFKLSGLDVTSMLVIWSLFLLILSFEKKIFGFVFGGSTNKEPKKIFLALGAVHWVILILTLAVVFLGVFQGHG